MKLISTLSLLVLVSFSALARASASEEARTLPWSQFVRESNGPAAGTQLLGTYHLGSRIDMVRVSLPQCGNTIQAVELKVQNAPVTVASFGVRFTDGTSRDFNVNQTFAAGTDSGWIDLALFRSEDSRCPTEVYAKASSPGNATVLVYGTMK